MYVFCIHKFLLYLQLQLLPDPATSTYVGDIIPDVSKLSLTLTAVSVQERHPLLPAAPAALFPAVPCDPFGNAVPC